MNQEIANIFQPAGQRENFDRLQISLASPERILSWSFGEIKKPECLLINMFQ